MKCEGIKPLRRGILRHAQIYFNMLTSKFDLTTINAILKSLKPEGF